MIYAISALRGQGLTGKITGLRYQGWPLAALLRYAPDPPPIAEMCTKTARQFIHQLDHIALWLWGRGCLFCGGEAHPERDYCPNCGAPTEE